MIKKTLTFENYDGETVTEDFYFNIEQFELVELEASENDGISKYLESIVSESDGAKIIAMYKKLLLLGYGQRTAKGGFSKTDEIRNEFMASKAFSIIAMEIMTEPGAAVEWVRGMLPTELMAKVPAESLQLPEVPVSEPEPITRNVEKTTAELAAMSQEELNAYFEQIRSS